MVLTDDEASAARISVRAIARDSPDVVVVRTANAALTAAELASRLSEPDPGATTLASGLTARGLGSDMSSVLAVVRAFEGPGVLVALHPRWPESERARRLAPLDALASFGLSRRHPDAALVCFTSGTSGGGTPMLHTRRTIAFAALSSLDRLGLAADDRCLLSMPLAHVGGASIVARCLAARASVVLDDAVGPFDAERWDDVVRASAVTHASVVPTMLKRIVESGRRAPPSLKRLVVGGAACDESLVRAASALGHPAVRSFGMTETFAMVTCESASGEGGSGRPLPGCELRCVDGELRVRTPALAREVVPAMSLALDELGFLRTRDACSFDASGALHVHGRTDDVIISGGENVHPSEVEAVLLGVHGVDGAVVFGEPDAEWGERVVAIYGGSIDPDALGASVRARLPAYARPKRIVQLDELPTLPSGKVDRSTVRALVR